MKITEFLLARIGEDEAAAQRAASLGADMIAYDTGDRRPDWMASAGDYDPARVLAECGAKRRIVEFHEPVDYSGLGMEAPNACALCGADLGMGDWEWMRNSFPCATLRALAAVHADHPDYDESWRP